MKKAICIITSVLLVIIITVSSFPTAAAEDVLDDDTARKLVKEAAEIRDNLGNCFKGFDKESGRFVRIEDESGNFGKWYLPIKPGCEKETFLSRIRNTFSASFAESLIQDSAPFFNGYAEQDGQELYFYNRGYPVYPEHGWVYFDEEELDEITVVEGSKPPCVLVPAHFDTEQRPLTFRLTDITVPFYFGKEDGQWKITEIDNSSMLFTLNGEENTGEEFTKEVARALIIASIYDVYYFLKSPNAHLCTDGMGCKIVNVEDPEGYTQMGINCTRLEGNLAKKETWMRYLDHFCTPEMSEKLLQSSWMHGLRVIDGEYYWEGTEAPDYHVGDRYFTLDRISPDNIRLEPDGSDKFIVNYGFVYEYSRQMESGPYHETVAEIHPLEIKVQRVDGRWKIYGGSFIDTLDDFYIEKGGVKIADTGDSSGNVFLWAAVALTLCASVLRKNPLEKGGKKAR